MARGSAQEPGAGAAAGEEAPAREPLTLAGERVAPGQRRRLEIPVGRRVTHAEVHLPCEVLHGRRDGPRLFVCAAIHGDEINGVEIVRRLLERPLLRRLRGTLLAVPIVNVHGFVAQSRYLPDRRDLNRSFPGSAQGSLASRVAHRFMSEVVGNATHGIDLHTGALHRSNLPQIRACLDQPATRAMAMAFGAPVVLHANLRDGSLRQAVLEDQIPMLVYEGGEALRFDEAAIRAGVRGVLGVMRALGMLGRREAERPRPRPFEARGSRWVRAPDSGILTSSVRLGAHVEEGELLGTISDPLGAGKVDVCTPDAGIVIGMRTLPLVNEGDALFHVATFDDVAPVAEGLMAFQEELLEE